MFFDPYSLIETTEAAHEMRHLINGYPSIICYISIERTAGEHMILTRIETWKNAPRIYVEIEVGAALLAEFGGHVIAKALALHCIELQGLASR